MRLVGKHLYCSSDRKSLNSDRKTYMRIDARALTDYLSRVEDGCEPSWLLSYPAANSWMRCLPPFTPQTRPAA